LICFTILRRVVCIDESPDSESRLKWNSTCGHFIQHRSPKGCIQKEDIRRTKPGYRIWTCVSSTGQFRWPRARANAGNVHIYSGGTLRYAIPKAVPRIRRHCDNTFTWSGHRGVATSKPWLAPGSHANRSSRIFTPSLHVRCTDHGEGPHALHCLGWMACG
jgi:hypothetical protein